jgi:fatty-acid desaturase
MLTFGEGWHNNHHAAPQSARHGLAWYEIDMNYYGIYVLRMLGLAWDIKLSKLNQTPENGRVLAPPPVVDDEALAPTIASGD